MLPERPMGTPATSTTVSDSLANPISFASVEAYVNIWSSSANRSASKGITPQRIERFARVFRFGESAMIGVRGRNAATRSAVVPVSVKVMIALERNVSAVRAASNAMMALIWAFRPSLSMIVIRRLRNIALSRNRSATLETRAMNLTAATG